MAFAPSLLRRTKKPSGPQLVLNDLLARIRKRLYPETLPVLASYWLKTVYSAGHNLAWWSQLDARQVFSDEQSSGAQPEPSADIHAYIRHEVLDKTPRPSLGLPPRRPSALS